MASTYRLHHEINAVITVNGKPQILPIPAGSIITVTQPEPSVETGLVSVAWGDKIVKMFATDVEVRGVPLA